MDLELVFYLLTSPEFILIGLAVYLTSLITIYWIDTGMKANYENGYRQGFSKGKEMGIIKSEVLR